MLDAYGGGVGFSRRRNRPLQINRSPIGMFGNYALSASLPGMIDEMNQQFEELNHSFDDMIRVFSDPNTRATHVCFVRALAAESAARYSCRASQLPPPQLARLAGPVRRYGLTTAPRFARAHRKTWETTTTSPSTSTCNRTSSP